MAKTKHLTLTANTVAEVDLDYASSVEVINVDGAAAVYFTVGGVPPVIAGDDTQVLPACIGGLEVAVTGAWPGRGVVKLISAGTPAVSVRVAS